MGGIFIQRKTKSGKEIVQVIPREAVYMVELLGDQLAISTKRSAPYTEVGIKVKPEQVEKVKAQLLSFAEGKVLLITEKE
jgi:hypothetical protein